MMLWKLRVDIPTSKCYDVLQKMSRQWTSSMCKVLSHKSRLECRLLSQSVQELHSDVDSEFTLTGTHSDFLMFGFSLDLLVTALVCCIHLGFLAPVSAEAGFKTWLNTHLWYSTTFLLVLAGWHKAGYGWSEWSLAHTVCQPHLLSYSHHLIQTCHI